MVDTVAVLGGGHGAHAVAADLSLAGFKVSLCEHPRFRETFKPTLERGEVEILGKAREGVAKLHRVTTDFKEAVEDAEVIILVVPSFGHRLFAESFIPHLRDGQLLVLMPGNAGSLEVAKMLKESRVRRDLVIAETATLPYGCRLIGPAKVMVYVTAKVVPIGVLPSKRTDEALEKLRELYPMLTPATNVLEAAINNPNPITHPIATLLNVGRIEYSKGEFYLYREGITPSVVKVYDAVDAERRALCKRLGIRFYECPRDLPREDCEIRMGIFFGARSLREAGWQMKGPSSTLDRYVTEDVPYGLVFMESLGSLIGVQTPTISSVITLFSVINGVDYRKEGRTVEKLGIAEMSLAELNEYLSEWAPTF